jgi:putative ABC transport system substrate-binding protein
MRRREFIALVGGAAAGWPLAARAQRTALPVIGFLGSSLPDEYTIRLRAFRQGLKDEGFIEGQNIIVEYRWAEDQNSRLPPLAAELVRRQVKVIVAGGGSPSALAAKAATTTVPSRLRSVLSKASTDPAATSLASPI